MQITYAVIGILIAAILFLALPVSYKVRLEARCTLQLCETHHVHGFLALISVRYRYIVPASLFAAGD